MEKKSGCAANAGMKLHVMDCEEKHDMRKHIEALEKQNTNLLRENEKIKIELREYKKDIVAITADRDNWRRQALDEDSRIDGILYRLRRYFDTSNEEERRSKAHMDAYNAKQAAFKELVDFALIPEEGNK